MINDTTYYIQYSVIRLAYFLPGATLPNCRYSKIDAAHPVKERKFILRAHHHTPPTSSSRPPSSHNLVRPTSSTPRLPIPNTTTTSLMSRFFDNPPTKKSKATHHVVGQSSTTTTAGGSSSSGAPSSDGFRQVGEISPNRVCPDDECPHPKQLLVRYKNNRPFVVCSKNKRDEPSSCQFTANKFLRERTSKGESKIACICCGIPLERSIPRSGHRREGPRHKETR